MGQWLARALNERGADLRERYGVAFEVVGVANRRDGFFYRESGLDLRSVRSLSELPDARQWPTALEGLRETDADVLVEVSESPPPSGEPGRSHLEEALGRGIPVVTSNKWPVALHGVELAELGRAHSAPLRAESTVMSGTPVLSTLREGLGGASPIAIRGVVNATANYIASEMGRGTAYADALAVAQEMGLAERDPSADVDGHDAVAKAMVLSGLVFGRQLRLEDVSRTGISSVTEEKVARAVVRGQANPRGHDRRGFRRPRGARRAGARRSARRGRRDRQRRRLSRGSPGSRDGRGTRGRPRARGARSAQRPRGNR